MSRRLKRTPRPLQERELVLFKSLQARLLGKYRALGEKERILHLSTEKWTQRLRKQLQRRIDRWWEIEIRRSLINARLADVERILVKGF